MTEHLSTLQAAKLFGGIDAAELDTMLNCIDAKTKVFRKGRILLLAGDKPQFIGVVLKGQLHIVREDYDGNRSLIGVMSPGDVFAEAMCFAGVEESPVTVVAEQTSTVILLSFDRILHTCPNSCSFHRNLIRNMLELVAKKNLQLQSHMEILSMKSIRSRVLLYFESLSARRAQEFTIPLNREEMADYLCVDRSALSHELAKMRKDGLIDYSKNRFMLK